MANFLAPRRGSAAAIGLNSLHGLGNIARVSAWTRQMAWLGSDRQFLRNVIEPSVRAGLVRLEGDLCEMTPAGLEYLGFAPKKAAEPAREPVAPMYRPDWRDTPRGNNRQRAGHLARPGSFDYRDIPSRIGQERLAYKSSLVVEGDAA